MAKISERKLSDYQPDPANANKGTERGVYMLDESLSRFGAGRSILVDKNGIILAGNKTGERAADLGITDVLEVESVGNTLVVVKRTDLDLMQDDEHRARGLAYADNRAGQVGLAWDAEQLLKDANAGIDLGVFWKPEELEELLRGVMPDPPSDPGAAMDRAAELQEKWGTARGQIWQVGRHRVMCGDSTSAEDVGALFGDARAEMVWTDPPYGVAVGDKNKMLNAIARSNRVEENLTNDTLDEAGLVAMLSAAFDVAMQFTLAGGAWYVAAPPGPLHVLFGQVLKDRGIWHQTIQWVKNNATFSPMGVDYHWRAEPIFYGWLPNGAHRYYGGRKQDTVWEIDRPVKSPEHPTMKPVELVARAIRNSSCGGEIVYDAFVGSGTTAVAAEQLGRICYGVEIEPKYVAVTLERLSGMGLEPRLTN